MELSNRIKEGWVVAISEESEFLHILKDEFRADYEMLEPFRGWEIMLLKKSDSLRESMEETGIVIPMEKLLFMHIMGKVANRLMIEHIGVDGDLDDEAIDVLLWHIMKGEE